MSSPIERQWAMMDHSDTLESQAQAPAAEPRIELPINTKPTEKEFQEPIPSSHIPQAPRSFEGSFYSEMDDDHVDSRPRRRPDVQAYSPSPIRVRSNPRPENIVVPSSIALLSTVSNYDGVADLPFPSRSSVYLTTFPFTDRDVKKWSWFITRGIEDVFMISSRDGDLETEGNNRYPYYVTDNRMPPMQSFEHNNEMPHVYLSRALDPTVVTEKMEKMQGVRYFIVVQNGDKPKGTKLKVAESRKAAAMMIYYESLGGNSIDFVGAVVGHGKLRGAKLVRSESVKTGAHEEGVVGVIC
ncbi:hypothetical protein BDV96DRAFT_238909 [Lophiotrema nucula]|uniref:Uncharacterized protein n=1 Tax=Lophiotrema nucula TaxID=690887 RepID=A0A6A5YSS9_9PLEO|nr:hypothetical protein BDV96DRAFT_238909 [Lophiotrema nucula]